MIVKTIDKCLLYTLINKFDLLYQLLKPEIQDVKV